MIVQPENNAFYVYLHRRNDTNKVFYVGKGKGSRAWHTKGRNPYWNNVANKHGCSVEVLFGGLSEDEAYQTEIDVINELRYMGEPLVNMNKGGDGNKGMTAEVRAKIGEASRNRAPDSEETKRKKSESNKNRVFTEEHRRKLSENNKMRDLSVVKKVVEARRKTIQANPERYKGVNVGGADKTIYTFRNRYTGELFTGNIFDFSESFGLNRNNVRTITKGQCAYTGDWEMYDESKDNTILLVRKLKEPKMPKGRHKPKGDSNPRYDNTVYTFIHMGNGIVESCTSFELQTKHSLSRNIRAVVLGRIIESGGWRLIENKDRKINRNGHTV